MFLLGDGSRSSVCSKRSVAASDSSRTSDIRKINTLLDKDIFLFIMIIEGRMVVGDPTTVIC